MELEVLVPKPGTPAALTIDSGSGIVTDATKIAERIEVYFEGNRFGAVNLRTFEERVKQAAGRLQQRYPTIARGFYAPSEFESVGTYTFSDDWKETRLAITNQEALDAWCR